MSVHDKLLRILENTSDFTVDDMWPDRDVPLDDIVTQLLEEHAHELAEKIRAKAGELIDAAGPRVDPADPKYDKAAGVALAADLIDPQKEGQ